MFKSVKINLTAWYLLIIMTVTLSFSAVVYAGVSNITQRALEVHERRIENRLQQFQRFNAPPPRFQEPINVETVKEIRTKTLIVLGFVNLFVLAISGLLGYFLAEKTLKPIEVMSEKQKKFIADAAHELKTPLTAIKTNIEVNLRKKGLKLKEAKAVLNETVDEIDSLSMLTNSMLRQSKYEEGKSSKKEEVDLKKLLESLIRKFGPRIDEKKIILDFKVESELLTTGVKEDLKEVFTILIDNAVKFNKEKGLINVVGEYSGNYAKILIEDSGIGISDKDLHYIFDRFYKADSSRSRDTQSGYGLGLSIAKEIVKNHNGKISVISKKGKGTTFTVKLPIK